MTGRGDPLGTERWKRLRKLVLREDGDVCWICGHGGSKEVDHVIPRQMAPELVYERSNLRPAHGTSGPCPVCRQRCNQRRPRSANGHGRRVDASRTTRDDGWTVERCPFAGMEVKRGQYGPDWPRIDSVHDPHCRQNHGLPW